MCGVPHHAVQALRRAGCSAPGSRWRSATRWRIRAWRKGIVSRARRARRHARDGDRGGVPRSRSSRTTSRRWRATATAVALLAADLSTGEMRARGARRRRRRSRERLARLAPRELLIDGGRRACWRRRSRRALPAAMLTRAAGGALRRRGRRGVAARRTRRDGAAARRPRRSARCSATSRRRTAPASTTCARRRATPRRRVLHIDEASRRNLELLATTRGERRGSLLGVLDETHTPMGGRLLRQWLLAPLTDSPPSARASTPSRRCVRAAEPARARRGSCSAPSATSSG